MSTPSSSRDFPPDLLTDDLIADHMGIVMSRMAMSQGDTDPGSEGWVTLPDGSGLRIMCYIDHDWMDYALVEVRAPFRYRAEFGTAGAGPTVCDYLFVHRHPGKDGQGPYRTVQWRGEPFELFDSGRDWWAVYREFLEWCEKSTSAWHLAGR